MNFPVFGYRPWMVASLVALMALAPTQVFAEVYSYTDSRGKKVFVDSPSKIPAQYRQKTESRSFTGQSRITQATDDVVEDADTISERFKLESKLRKLNKTLARMETQVSIRGNQVIVPVKVNWRGAKKTLNLLLDTGASITVLHQNSVSSLNPVSRETNYAMVAGGGKIKTERVVFDQLSVGPYDIENKNTAVIDHQGGAGFDGLLGMDVLGSLKYDIDFEDGKIVWSPEQYDELLSFQLQLEQRISDLKNPDAEAKSEKSPQ